MSTLLNLQLMGTTSSNSNSQSNSQSFSNSQSNSDNNSNCESTLHNQPHTNTANLSRSSNNYNNDDSQRNNNANSNNESQLLKASPRKVPAVNFAQNRILNCSTCSHDYNKLVNYSFPNVTSIEQLFNKKENFNFLMKSIFNKILIISSPPQTLTDVLAQTKNEKFTDELFPPNENSLLKGYNNTHKPISLISDIPIEKTLLQKKWKTLRWKRHSELFPSHKLFPSEIKSNDIKPNAYSNSKFISALSALAEFPKRIRNIFLTQKTCDECVFSVQLCKNGLLKEIVVDDYIPVTADDQLAFSGNDKSLWVSVLEKAYAKAYGSYNLIEIKDVEGILRDLTCAPVVTLDNSKEDLIKELFEAYEKEWIILASAGDTKASQDLLNELTLKPNYEYAILMVYMLSPQDFGTLLSGSSYNDESNYKTLLKIRNLWSDIEWIGDWSEISTFWTNELRKKLQHEGNDDTFYMNLKDFKHYFSKIKICKYMDGYHYNSLQIEKEPEKHSLIQFTVTDKNTHAYISLVQEDHKNYKTNEYIYGISRLILCHMRNESISNIEYICGKMGQEREITIERALVPGDYLLFCELSKIQTTTPYVVSIYSSLPVSMSELLTEEHPNILERIYISCAKIQNCVSSFEQENAPNCFKYSTSTPEGYTYIYFDNQEEDATVIEDVKYTKFEGLKLLPPFKGTSYRVEVGPGKDEIILIKHLELNEYNLIFSYQSSIRFGKRTLMHLTKECGTVKKRKDKKMDKELDIDVYIYKHTFGLCYYYENNTANKKLKETLNIANNTNVDFVGEKEGTNEVVIVVGPGETHFVELRGKNNLWKVQPLITYAIETLQDAAQETNNESKETKE